MKNARNRIFTNLHVIRASDSDGEGRPSFKGELLQIIGEFNSVIFLDNSFLAQIHVNFSFLYAEWRYQ
jgi:hypothetical protein